MKAFLVIFVALVVFQNPADAFISSLINSVSNTINTVTLAGQFLWDNALQPSLQVLQNNTVNLIDNYFGNLLNGIGKRSTNAELIAQHVFIKTLYLQKMSELNNGLKTIFFNFVNQLGTALTSSIQSLMSGSISVNQLVDAFLSKAKEEILQLISTTFQGLVNPLKNMNQELNGLVMEFKGIFDSIYNAAVSGFNVVASTLVLGVTSVINFFG